MKHSRTTTSQSGRPSGPRSLSSILDVVVQHAQQLQLVLIAVGVLGLCLVPLLERKIDFDENALLAGSARPTISLSSPSAYEAGKAFAGSLRHTYNTFAFSTALQDALSAHGFDVSTHSFTAPAPPCSRSLLQTMDGIGSPGSPGASSSSSVTPQVPAECVNVHVVLHSPRGDGKEALVLVTPINHQDFVTDFQQDVGGVRLSLALGFALLHHLSTATWLSKEVIWLLPDASCGLVAAVTAWTDTYQLTRLDQAGNQAQFSRAGVLQQALLLELPSAAFNRVQVGLEGHAGQLPKLDMYWLYRWYSQAYVTAPVELPELTNQLAPPLQLMLDTLRPLLSLLPVPAAADVLSRHLHKLQLMWQFMLRQARGLPTGAHAAFKGLGVDAATLRVLVRNDSGRIVSPVGFTGGGNAGSAAEPFAATLEDFEADQAWGSAPRQYAAVGGVSGRSLVGFDSALHQLGNVMEASLRSCSVLIERFHHSLFLYVLTGLDTYVSVERYIGPLVALICVLVLQAASISQARGGPSAPAQPDSPAAAAPTQQQPPPPPHETQAGCSKGAPEQHSGGAAGQLAVLPVVELHSIMLPGSCADAAAARAQWFVALKLVLVCHACCTGLAAVLWSARYGDVGVSAFTLGGSGLLGAVVAGLVLSTSGDVTALWLRATATADAGSSDGPHVEHRRRWPPLTPRLLVVELSVSAAAMAAVACINWALGYIVCGFLVLLVSLSLPAGLASAHGPIGAHMLKSRAWGWLVPIMAVALCSPLSLGLMLSGHSGGSPCKGWGPARLLSLADRQGSWSSLCVACGVYLPCWVMVVVSVVSTHLPWG